MPWIDGEDIFLYIQDGKTPKDVANFIKLVEWTAEQLRDGKKIHAGCIGGHGRTGLFFAALVAHMGIEKDAINYVRDNYCDRAVESKLQIDFLIKHFDVRDADGTKEQGSSISTKDTDWFNDPPKGWIEI
jgi:protein-tyrosine phosphatase